MKVGYEYHIVSKKHKEVVLHRELIDYYVMCLNLYYDDDEAQKWLATKMIEDVNFLYQYNRISKAEILKKWLLFQLEIIEQFVDVRYNILEEHLDEANEVVQTYEIWLEEKNA